jgi:hypothetical protein
MFEHLRINIKCFIPISMDVEVIAFYPLLFMLELKLENYSFVGESYDYLL